MIRSNRIQQLYGYSVCLVAIITALVTISSLMRAAMARAEPLRSDTYGYSDNRGLSSYEAYAAANPEHRTIQRPSAGPGAEQVYDTLSTVDSRARYDALRAEREAQVRFESTRDLLTNGVLLFLALALFLAHWRWLHRLPPEDAVPVVTVPRI